jgi:acyl-CoA synthetase (NDP forming)
MAEFAPDTLEALDQTVPHTASVRNPVDMTFARNYNDYLEKLPRILLSDKGVDALFVYLLMPHKRVIRSVIDSVMDNPENSSAIADNFFIGQAAAVAGLSREFGKPVVGASFHTRSELFIREVQDRGLPVLSSPERATRALGALTRYSRFRQDMANNNDD